jgi:hypothetical protein
VSAPGPERRVLVRFATPWTVGASGVVALEDYARELTRASAAEALPADAAGRLPGIALVAPAVAPEGDVLEDIEAFARDLAERDGFGLGWS